MTSEQKIIVIKKKFPGVKKGEQNIGNLKFSNSCFGRNATHVSASLQNVIVQSDDPLKGLGAIDNSRSKTSITKAKSEVSLTIEALAQGEVFKEILNLGGGLEEGIIVEGKTKNTQIPISVKIFSDYLMQTTSGSLIKAKFIFKFGGYSGSKEVKISKEIILLESAFPTQEFESPADWKPQEIDVHSFRVNVDGSYSLEAVQLVNPLQMPMSKQKNQVRNQGKGGNPGQPMVQPNVPSIKN